MEPADDLVERVLRDALTGRNSNTQALSIQTPGTSVLSVAALIVAALVSFFALYIAADAKSQARADRQELLDEIRALKDDAKGVRAYIQTGILKPLPEKDRAK